MGSTTLRKNKIKPQRLNDKQIQFAHEYMVDMNATRAAQAVGYKVPGNAGIRLLASPAVDSYIGSLRNKKLAKVDLKADDIIRELAYCIFRDPKDLCDENGRINIEFIGNLPKEIRKTIDSIRQTEHYDNEGNHLKTTTELKMVSKLGAINLGMQHMGMLTEQHEHKHLVLSFDEMYGISKKPDPIEQRILEVK